MSDNITILGGATGNELSVIKDPFIKDCIGEIHITRTKKMFGDGFYWWGAIKFTNGNTRAEQRVPDCNSFEEAVEHMKAIINSIKQ